MARTNTPGLGTARKQAAEAARMTGWPQDEKNPLPKYGDNPLADDFNTGALILWLAHKAAKALIGFDATPAAGQPEKK